MNNIKFLIVPIHLILFLNQKNQKKIVSLNAGCVRKTVSEQENEQHETMLTL